MLTPYCASKAGIILFTQAFAKEVGQHKINVNCVCPGMTMTEALRLRGHTVHVLTSKHGLTNEQRGGAIERPRPRGRSSRRQM